MATSRAASPFWTSSAGRRCGAGRGTRPDRCGVLSDMHGSVSLHSLCCCSWLQPILRLLRIAVACSWQTG
jgi:hypothetical protein